MGISGAQNELDFPINQKLLEEATRAMEEWRLIKERLTKIEENRNRVSDNVYERVRADYESRLSDATGILISKKEELDHELESLRETRKRIEAQLERHRQQLEEVKFRNTLGEFTAEEFRDKSRAEEEKISKFETVLNAVDNNVERYESIFEGETDLFATQEATAPEEEISEVAEVSAATPAPHDIEPLTDEAGYVLEEGEPDYFGTTGKIEGSPGSRDASNTAKAAIKPMSAEEVKDQFANRPRIVIINGDNAGAAYPVKGTTSFGRAESNTIALKDAKVSRQHAQIQQQGKEYVLIDLNSSNGTFANGERIEEHVLSNGDEIQIGDSVMQFQFDS